MKKERRIYLAKSRGFCAGVIRAVKIVEDMLEEKGTPLYVRHEIVHNNYVVNSFKNRGVKFIEKLSEVPKGQSVIFSAHGVSPAVERDAEILGLHCVDATCPLVKKIHKKSIALKNDGYKIILIGDKDHPELIGTLGHLDGEAIIVDSVESAQLINIPSHCKKITYLTQTTLSTDDVQNIVDLLVEKFPNLEIPEKSDICYATLERQNGIKKLAKRCDSVLVIGSKDSSNSKRLAKVAKNIGANTLLIDSYRDISDNFLQNANNIAVTSGASAPEILVQETLEYLVTKGYSQ